MDFRILIEEEIAARAAKNKSYSLTAFSRDIGVSPSFLTRLLRNQRKLSIDAGMSIAEKLRWSEKKTLKFIYLVKLDNEEDLAKREELKAKIAEMPDELHFTAIPPDLYDFFAKWFHFGILELTKVNTFKPDPKWIAKKLGLDLITTELAIDRLFRLGFLEKRGNFPMVTANPNIEFKDIPSLALRSFHKGMLQRAIKMLDEEENHEERMVTGTTMAVNLDKLPSGRKKIAEFRKDMVAMLESGKKREGVYHLTVCLVRLDQKET
ncbi:MAG: DUF4423 domain-containing protein [Oligoflexales bacterium]